MNDRLNPSRSGFSALRIAGNAYRFAFRNLRPLLMLGALPLLTIFAVNLVTAYLQLSTGSFLWWLSRTLIVWVVASSFAVSWHRYVLLGETAAKAPFHFSFGPREGRYFLYLMLVSLPFIVAMPALALAVAQTLAGTPSRPAALLGLGLLAAGLIIAVRSVLVFPSAAVDVACDLKHSWTQTRGIAWRLFFLLVLTLLPGQMLGLLIATSAVFGGGLVQHIVGAVIAFFGNVVLIAGMSFAFRDLTGWTPTPLRQKPPPAG